MKKLTLFISILLTGQLVNAQVTFQKTFETTSGDGGYIIRQTQDNGYILLSAQISYSYIVKTDSLGSKLWSIKINSGGAHGLNQTADGGYILSGGINTGSFLIKLNSTGNIVWQSAYSFPPGTPGYFNYVKDDIDGTGYIVEGIDGNAYNLVLMKVGFSGNLIWHVKMRDATMPYGPHSGGFVQLQSDSSFIVFSTTRDGADDALLCSKFSKTGNNMWVKKITVSGMATTNYVDLSIKKTYNGNVMISFYPYGDFVELDTSGTPVSAMRYTLPYGMNWDFANPALDKSMFISGTTPNGVPDVRLMKTNSSGNIVWSKKIGGANSDGASAGGWTNASGITNDGNNGCAVIGSTRSFSGPGGAIYLIKTDSAGTFSCNADSFPIPTVTFPTAATTNFSCIFSSPPCTINPIYFTTSNPNDTSYDACGCVPPVANFSAGNPIIQDNSTWASTWYWDYGNGQTDSSVVPDPVYAVDGTYYVCLIVSNACGTDSFCDSITYVYQPVNVQELEHTSIFKITPNPAASEFTIYDLRLTISEIEIYNMLGEKVFSQQPQTSDFKPQTVDVSQLPAGIYFVKVFDGEKYYCRKLIVEH